MPFGVVASKYRRKGSGQPTTIDGLPVTYRKGTHWYVDAANGKATNGGTSWEDACSSMTTILTKIASGAFIHVAGKVLEQCVAPVQIFDVTIIGEGNRPRHADSTPAGGNTHTAQWGPPASGGVAAQATLRVLQQGWRFENMLFTMIDANAGGVELVRNADAGNAERDASHASFINCRFAGPGIGIKVGAAGFTELVFNVLVDDCKFNSCTAGIGGTGQLNQPIIRGNHFTMNTDHISVAVEGGTIYNNIMGKFTTQSIKLDGGVGTDPNVITKNYLFGTFSIAGGYKSHHADDEWGGNDNAAGHTTVDPA